MDRPLGFAGGGPVKGPPVRFIVGPSCLGYEVVDTSDGRPVARPEDEQAAYSVAGELNSAAHAGLRELSRALVRL